MGMKNLNWETLGDWETYILTEESLLLLEK